MKQKRMHAITPPAKPAHGSSVSGGVLRETRDLWGFFFSAAQRRGGLGLVSHQWKVTAPNPWGLFFFASNHTHTHTHAGYTLGNRQSQQVLSYLAMK